MKSRHLLSWAFVIFFMVITVVASSSLGATQNHTLAPSSSTSTSSPVYSHESDTEALKARIAETLHNLKSDPSSQSLLEQLAEAYRSIADETNDRAYLSQALEVYLNASKIGQDKGHILYTSQIAELLVQLGDQKQLDDFFEDTLAAFKADQGARFVALVDYADALAKFKDDRAWSYFEQAITSRPDSNIEGYNRYAQALIDRGLYRQAVEVLSRLSPEARIAAVVPSALLVDALEHLGGNASSAKLAKAEYDSARSRFTTAVAIPTTSAKESKFLHNSSTDDCRNPGNPIGCVDDGHGTCWWYFVVNLAEVLYNEAHLEKVGAQDLVGWTVRDRALEGVSCDVYVGGVNYTTCRNSLPCGGGVCDLSRWYCCVLHGGTTTAGTSQSQFNDAHVTMQNLYSSGLIIRAGDMVNGRSPELSTLWIPPGISGCSTTCGTSHCTTGFNNYDASPNGPMEYLNHNYCAARPSCKTPTGNVCGDSSPYTSNCNSTVANDNFFWNRLN